MPLTPSWRNAPRLFARASRNLESPFAGPIRGELLGAEHLAERARTVAQGQSIASEKSRWGKAPLLTRLHETERILREIHERLASGTDARADLGTAGEWLLDNFYVVEEHVREVGQTLPRGYYRELPELDKGPLAGYPRVYELAISLISHTEGRIDLENVSLFASAFQEVKPLKIGELWALPAMLRLGLIENIRRMALRTVQRLDELKAADRWIGRIRKAGDRGALRVALGRLASDPLALKSVFTARFLRQLQEEENDSLVRRVLEQWMMEEGFSADTAEVRASQRVALTQVMMANSITSLRTLGRVDWNTFVEQQSAMEAVLKGDPSGFYSAMTFRTRDRYRHVVERIARRSELDETEVAHRAIDLCHEAPSTSEPPIQRLEHVGYYLIAEGLSELEETCDCRPSMQELTYRWVHRHPNVVYFGGLVLGSSAVIAGIVALVAAETWGLALLVALLAFIPATDVAIIIVNQVVTAFLPPQPLPRLDFRTGGKIPEEFRTAVVVPTLFPNVEAVEGALEHLEVQYLANRERHLYFAILSDFTDSRSQFEEGDAAIVEAAEAGIRDLNARYSAGARDTFYLFHRPRLWNPQEGVWMGWERKRGKLSDFNRFVRGDDGAFDTVVGDVNELRKIRYVITLDSDTILPPNAAARLVGTLAHPLNRPVHDPETGRVVQGYGILQPRVGVSLPSAHASRFAAIFSGHPGVDPYTTAVSDVYQDLFEEGSFTGKGIYEVDAFELATKGRFPENTLLSHDLIEGNYARAGLATDVIVYDDFPGRYLTYTRRKHRWIRGDWQLIGWLTGTAGGEDGLEPDHLPFLARWKILDNLRRSLVEIGFLVLLLAGWTILPGSRIAWTVGILGMISAPWIVALLAAVVNPPLDKSWRAYYGAVWQDVIVSLQQTALKSIFLLHQAIISVDAIARTLWRVMVSRRHLLEWQTASQTEQSTGRSEADVWRVMWPTSALAIALAGGVLVDELGGFAVLGGLSTGPELPLWQLLVAVLPLAILWTISPWIAHVLSRSALTPDRTLSGAGKRTALRYALLHWRYFDRFVTAETRWLAPDNFQEDPTPTVAMRTSPTNVGLQLLATVSAHDLGFLSLDDMTRRLERAFETLESMPRFRGHFYNWYDLNDLRVLEPAYVSTVDSGNLAGHLIALRQACLTLPDAPLRPDVTMRAMATSLALAAERFPDGEATTALLDVRETLKSASSGSLESDIPETISRAVEVLTQRGFSGESPEMEWLSWAHRRLDSARLEHQSLRKDGPEDDLESATLRHLALTSPAASELVARLESLAVRAHRFTLEMDFRFLFDENQKLFSIGYHESSRSLDSSYYDLLASEARLTSYVAVAMNEVPVGHWFALGRTLTHSAGETALVSWSGSMFEYLMPALVMQSYPATLLYQTYRGAVHRQIAYGTAAGAPWGISESAYNLRDRHSIYQYRAFGVPDLALKRGLGRDLVIAPYASALALPVDPVRSLANMEKLEEKGALGSFGFYDAIDYTRPDPDERFSIVRNYMAHHVGMTLVALTNILLEQPWPRRFHMDPLVQAAELLLYERIPRRLVLQEPQTIRSGESLPDPDLDRPVVREIESPNTPTPRVALLGRLPYTIMVTNGGGGYSRYEKLAVNRWRADGTTDDTGQFCYIKDLRSGLVWSAGHQPTCTPSDSYHVAHATDRVTFRRVDGDLETTTEITVVPEDSAEVRRVTVTNRSDVARDVELTSYGEIVLAPTEADQAHPAFSNLFVETEWHDWCTAVTATRRPRASDEPVLWLVHVVDAGKHHVGRVTCETDRGRFIGRGRSVRRPLALENDGELSGTTGAVLDPIFALRVRLHLEPGHSAAAAFTTLVATSRSRAFELADRYNDPHAAQRALDLAWTSTQEELRELGVTPADAAAYQDLAGHLFYPSSSFRAPQEERDRNRGSRPLLWSLGFSGDWPILLATIKSADGLPTLRQLLSAHRYWRRRGMMVDLVVINAHPPTYLRELSDAIVAMLYATHASDDVDRPGGVFIRPLDQVASDALLMLRASAPVHIVCDGRPLSDLIREPGQGDSSGATKTSFYPILSRAMRQLRSDSTARSTWKDAPDQPRYGAPEGADEFENGFGTLRSDGSYQILVKGDHVPPAPWANVIANPHSGFLVTERGSGFTWSGSSYFYRLTPWHNDPVSDPPGEALYLRDEESLEFWSATPAPVERGIQYTVRHSTGQTSFDHEFSGIETRLEMTMAADDAVKISILRLTNASGRLRRVSVTAYVSWTLGVLREQTQHHVRTFVREDESAIYAQNTFDPEFAGMVGFSALSEPLSDFTADRLAFIGRNGSLSDPEGLRSQRLGKASGTGLDPCAALQCVVELEAGESRIIVFLLGAAEGEADASRLTTKYRDARQTQEVVARVSEEWSARLGVVTVQTPEPSFDAMLNHWTLYQALSCRMWARSALYQSGGAYGFRDQLQDVLALLYAEPGIAREHILRAAARQFVEGDVQHWWHPHSGRGVRTRFSDDLVWLPYVVDQYVCVTGDHSILDEQVPFLAMRTLEPHEHEVYDLPQVTEEHASVYEHCRRALHRASTVGVHGLPLIGIGDWNDGMNRVGVEGKGESVWLGWFLTATLRAFASHAEAQGDEVVAGDFRKRAEAYVTAVESHGWDGAWYRRAFFDDGTPLGSAENSECRIDSIAQSWSVISGAGGAARRDQAMRSFEAHLVDEEARILKLLAPPFDETPLDPGYIKGYVPGVRENGAQYTHAALWSILATAVQGRGDRAFELFQMINPLNRTRTPQEVETYKVEPYVIAADVYAADGHVGRGGWTWYTGSASWMYRVGLECLLGFTKRENSLFILPHVPAEWPEFTIEYRFGTSLYTVTVHDPVDVNGDTDEVRLDGVLQEVTGIPLVDDGNSHTVSIRPALKP